MSSPSRTTISGDAQVDSVDYDLSGSMLGAWQLDRVLGEGAMGKVYSARHQRIGRTAAVKVLKAEHARHPDLVQRFIGEATAVNAIKNDHIVEVYDFGEQLQPDGSSLVYCVMEQLDGRPLSEAMGEHFTIARSTRLAFQLTRALGAAHHLGVVHRDVKPENLFLHRKDGDAEYLKVLDFGIAKLLKPIGDLPQSGTIAGTVIGTPEYMAPEQALGSATDARADLYAVGLILYELLSGLQPFTGDTFGKLVVEISGTPPPPLPAMNALGEPIHPTLVAIVMRCLEKSPDRRFQVAEELAAVLEPFVVGTAIAPASSVAPAPRRTLAPPPEPELPKLEKSKAPLVVLGLFALVVIGGVAVGLAPRASPPAPEPVPVVAPLAPVAVVPLVAAPKVWLEVASVPPGARVARTDSSVELGITPFRVELDSVEKVSLTFALEGYEPETRALALEANASVTVDLRPVPKQDVALPATKTGSPAGKKPVSRDGVVDPFNP
jgi:serine/threonine protein kinase